MPSRIFNILGIGIITVMISGLITYWFFPGTIMSVLKKIAVWDAELIHNQIDVDGYVVHYFEGGLENEQTLILLHGLGDDKNSFVRAVADLTETYRVILLDLPGHGENLSDQDFGYSIHNHVELLYGFTQMIGLTDFYIGGNSMGGHTAAAYSYYHQKQVKALILLNATGMYLENKSVYRYFPDEMNDDLFEELLSLVFAERPNVPNHFMEYFRVEMNKKIPFLNELVKQIMEGEDFVLNEQIEQITIPTLVLWGKQDQIVPIEYAEAYHQGLPNSTLQYLENAAHSPQVEIPKTVQYEIDRFIRNLGD